MVIAVGFARVAHGHSIDGFDALDAILDAVASEVWVHKLQALGLLNTRQLIILGPFDLLG